MVQIRNRFYDVDAVLITGFNCCSYVLHTKFTHHLHCTYSQQPGTHHPCLTSTPCRPRPSGTRRCTGNMSRTQRPPTRTAHARDSQRQVESLVFMSQVYYKWKRCSKKKCCKQCGQVTLTKWPVQKHTEHHKTRSKQRRNRHKEITIFCVFRFF